MTNRTVYRRLRHLGRKVGFDVGRWPAEQLGYLRTKVLLAQSVDLVIDVGANDGGYGEELRSYGYHGQIVSFEPISAPRRRLESIRDDRWQVLPYALGDANGTLEINVAGNAEASSSLLQMLPRHQAAAPESRFIRKEAIQVCRLDDLWPSIKGAAARPFVKIDVQGYEAEVLEGGMEALTDAIGIRIELTLVPLYENGQLWRQTITSLDKLGFSLVRLDPGFTDIATGIMLQCDGTFLHRNRAKLHLAALEIAQ